MAAKKKNREEEFEEKIRSEFSQEEFDGSIKDSNGDSSSDQKIPNEKGKVFFL